MCSQGSAAKRFLVVNAVLVMTLAMVGCMKPRGWTYSAMPPVDRAPLLEKSVAVPPFIDERKAENKDNFWLHMIPLMPGGWQELNSPEAVERHLISWGY